MNFFKKMIGMSPGLEGQIKNTKINGTLYRIIKDARNIILKECVISFSKDELTNQYALDFVGQSDKGQDLQYSFPIHGDMELVTFFMNKGGKQNACFEWSLDETGEHIGCYMNPQNQNKFRQIICQIIKIVLDDELIKDHLKLCKELEGIPVYKQSTTSSKISETSSKISSKSVQSQLNEVLLRQANRDENKMVNSAALYQIINKERVLINDAAVFVIRNVEKFIYQFQLINATGYGFVKKQINSSLVYEVNIDGAYLKWLQLGLEKGQSSKIIQVNFKGKKDVAMSVKFAIQQCLYEYNSKKKITDAIAEDQISYLKRMSEQNEPKDYKIVKKYEEEEDEIVGAKFIYGNEEADKGLQKYRTLCQAKIHNFDLASLGNMIETLKISDNNEVKRVEKRKLPQYRGQELNIDAIVLGDKDRKALMNDQNGDLHYYDLEFGKVVNSYQLSRKGIQDICPEYKLAETTDFQTYKAISPNTIYEIDPRTKDGAVSQKSYQTNPEFNRIAVDGKGRFACSSTTGEIRLFNKIGNNANCKYPGLGDPVLHLESTKDGKWLLATYKTYLILLPTETQDQTNLYDEKIKISLRPNPVKLKIKLEHLQLCGVGDYSMVPAKFDERKGSKETFIVSGFGEFAVIWNLSNVLKGNKNNYKFTKINGQVVQTDFMYDNLKKLIVTTSKGIVIKENGLKE